MGPSSQCRTTPTFQDSQMGNPSLLGREINPIQTRKLDFAENVLTADIWAVGRVVQHVPHDLTVTGRAREGVNMTGGGGGGGTTFLLCSYCVSFNPDENVPPPRERTEAGGGGKDRGNPWPPGGNAGTDVGRLALGARRL